MDILDMDKFNLCVFCLGKDKCLCNGDKITKDFINFDRNNLIEVREWLGELNQQNRQDY